MIRRLAALLLVMPAACSQSKTACECADPNAHVHVPSEDLAQVTEVRLSGAACEGQQARCTEAVSGGCATWSIPARAQGSCRVDVVFRETIFTATVTFAAVNDCCTGLYPTSGGEIEATRGPSDGGGAG
jgi:hypothetical protein